MSKKKENDEQLTSWDVLMLITSVGLLVTTTLAIAAGLSWWWPAAYLIALGFATNASIKNDEKKAEHDKENV